MSDATKRGSVGAARAEGEESRQPTEGLTEKVATWVADLDFEDVPAGVVARSKIALADYLAVAAAAAQFSTPLDSLLAVARAQAGGGGGCCVIGRQDRLPAMWAAMCNGGSAHYLELDDGHTQAHAHPGVTVIPALLAVGESAGVTGRDLLTAMAAGYELTIRLGRTVSPAAQYDRGFHIPGLIGMFAATAAVAKLRGLRAGRIVDALGNIALGPITPFNTFAQGAPVKDLYGGWPAAMGILGVDLAEQGITGSPNLLEGPMGWLQVVVGDGASPGFFDDLPQAWHLDEVYIKPHAACSLSHTSIDAALELRGQGWSAEQITEVTVSTHVFADRLTGQAPESTQGAKFSIPWMVAAALLDGEVFIEQSNESALQDQRYRDLARKVRVMSNDEYTQQHLADERRRPSRVELVGTDGQRATVLREFPSGGPQNPLDPGTVYARYLRLMEPSLGLEGAERLWALIDSIEVQEDPVGAIVQHLTVST